MSSTTRRGGRHRAQNRVELAVSVYYAIFLFMLFAEGALEKLCEHFAGLPVAYALFILGGAALGLIWLAWIDPERQLKDPISRFGLVINKRFGRVGLVVYGSLVVGSMGVAIVVKKLGHSCKYQLTLAPAIPFALVWVTIFHLT
jgi:hypothetical protein